MASTLIRRKYLPLDAADDDDEDENNKLLQDQTHELKSEKKKISWKKISSANSNSLSFKDLTIGMLSKQSYVEAVIVEEIFGIPRVVLEDSQKYCTIFDFSVCPPDHGLKFSCLKVGNALRIKEPMLSKLFDGEVGIACKTPENVEVQEKEWSDDERLRCCKECRARGNIRYSEQRYSAASSLYRTAISHLDLTTLLSSNKKLFSDLKLSCCLNIASCSFYLKNFAEVIEYSDMAVKFASEEPTKQAKAHYRKGQALIALHRFEEAHENLCKASSLLPNDSFIMKELKNVEQGRIKEKERLLAVRMFSGISKK